VWKFRTDGGKAQKKAGSMEGAINSTPSVSGDFVYFGSNDGNIYALHKNTGSLQWKYPCQAAVFTRVVVHKDKIYSGNMAGKVFCLQKESGQFLWEIQTKGSIMANPVYVDGILYVCAALNTGQGLLIAIQADSGQRLYVFRFEGIIRGAPVFKDGVMYVACMSGFVYAFGK
jgi:outer membrane protein assembly factor BamB